MPDLQSTGTAIVIAAVIAFVAWYMVGNEIMRRRARGLAIWAKRALDPLGGTQSILWITLHAFRLEVAGTRKPFESVSLTGLVESWDVPMVWWWNRLHGRRDLVQLHLKLRQQPQWGLELYRPGSMLAGDSRHLVRQEGWQEAQVDEFRLAPGSGAPLDLARRLLSALGDERAHLVRLALRRRDTHVTLALYVPDPSALPPGRFLQLAERVARAAVATGG